MFWILNIIGIGHNWAVSCRAQLGPHCVHMPIVSLNEEDVSKTMSAWLFSTNSPLF